MNPVDHPMGGGEGRSLRTSTFTKWNTSKELELVLRKPEYNAVYRRNVKEQLKIWYCPILKSDLLCLVADKEKFKNIVETAAKTY
jgi:hypothetical protein